MELSDKTAVEHIAAKTALLCSKVTRTTYCLHQQDCLENMTAGL